MALELEPKTFLEEMHHYFLQGLNLIMCSHILESIKQSLFLLTLPCCAHPQFITLTNHEATCSNKGPIFKKEPTGI